MISRHFLLIWILIWASLLQWNVYWQSSFDCSTVQDVSEQECEVLVDIYEDLQGDLRTSATSRMNETNISNWEGITVWIKNGSNHILSINLRGLWLIGQLPDSIDQLEYLEVLNISDNWITNLPQTIWLLEDLVFLDISNTSLSQLPNSVWLLSSLSSLDIWSTLIQQLPDMSGLQSLDQFNCTHSDLLVLPADLIELSDLNSVDCRRSDVAQINWLSSSIQSLLMSSTNITSIGPIALPNISTLMVDETPLVSIEVTGLMPDLDRLDVWETSLSSIDDLIEKIPMIQYLSLDNSLITSLWDISSLQALKELRFNNNQFQLLPQGVEELDALHVLYAWNNTIKWLLPAWLLDLQNLEYVYLNGNEFDRTVNHTIKNSVSLTQWANALWYGYSDSGQWDTTSPLVSLESTLPFFLTWGVIEIQVLIEENSYLIDYWEQGVNMTWSWWQSCSSLWGTTINENWVLDLSYAVWTWVYENCSLLVQDHAGNETSLQMWSRVVWDVLQDICLHPDLTVSVKECEALIQLYEETWGPSRYTDSGWFENPDIDTRHGIDVNEGHVVGLYLHKTQTWDGHGDVQTWNGNNLTWSFPESLEDLPYLQHINLSNNWFLWVIPDTFWWFSELESLIIKNNHLWWQLPTSLWDLDSLLILDLSDNLFSETIPASLGNLTSLQVLDLSDNDLQAELGNWIGTLQSLRILDLSTNELKGALPQALGSITSLEILRIDTNQFVWEVPSSRTELNLIAIALNDNALTRTVAHRPVMNWVTTQRWNTISTRQNSNQEDISAPIISMLSEPIAWSQTGAFDASLMIQEESYILDVYDQWMEVVFSWSILCEQLSSDYVVVWSWEVVVTITPWDSWRYEWCQLMIQDHGNNFSNSVVVWDFTTYDGAQTICYHPQLTTSRETCEALLSLYTDTDGVSWTSSTWWGEDSIVQNWLGVSWDQAEWTITDLNFYSNGLSWTVMLDLDVFEDLETLDLSQNTLTTIQILSTWDHKIRSITMSQSQIEDVQLPWLSYLSSLELFDIQDNMITWELPSELFELWSLYILDVSTNQFTWVLPTSFAQLTTIQTIDISNNLINWTLPIDIIGLETLTTLDVVGNALIRDMQYEAVLPVWWSDFVDTLLHYDAWSQDDLTAPVISSITHPQIVEWTLPVTVEIFEWSFAVTSSWAGMDISISGPGYCTSISPQQQVSWSSWTWIINLSLLFEWEYTWCIVVVTDHWWNSTSSQLLPFSSSLRCGNWIIDEWEVCDEWRSCADGRDCTQDPWLCPSECEVRLVDNCTPSCTISACWDAVVDSAWIDNVLGTYDDEQCDPWSYCLSTWEECGANPWQCPWWVQACKLRQTASCTPACSYGGCGDGYVDLDGLDDVLETEDDEACDLWDIVNGDGCSSTCQMEFCGDGLVDADWLDNNLSTLDDNEECDQWPHNGVQWWICTSACTIPDQECLYCYEVCDGWEWEHTMFLILDTSWSMWDNDKLQKAKDWAIEFVNLVEDRANWNTWFVTAIGLIEYWSDAQIVVSPTTNFSQVRNQIDNLYAGWSTNIGKALDVAHEYFAANQDWNQQHVVILSDGEPTVWWNGLDPVSWAYDRAQVLESLWAWIYTIALELSFEWIEIMRWVSSSSISNLAPNGNSSQSSTKKWHRPAWDANDGALGYRSIAQTKAQSESYRDLDLGDMYVIDVMKLRNRTWSFARKTADYHVMVRDIPFSSSDLQTMLNDPQTWSVHTPWQAWRPTLYPMDTDVEWRYIRVQQAGATHFTINEFEVLWCKIWEPCYEVFSYEDYQWDAIELIYSHIFGSIHCGCSPEQVCSECGDGEVYEVYGETCDLWSQCNDGSDCSNDPDICPWECAVISDATCTNQCHSPVCGDSIVTTPNADSILEECDNGTHCSNNSPCSIDSQCSWIWDGECTVRSGDGCNNLCQIESCGDRIVDYDGPDNIRNTSDDEQCDDWDQNQWENRCQNDCTRNPTHAWDPWLCGISDAIYNELWDGLWLIGSNPLLCDIGVAVDFQYYPGVHSRWWSCLWEQWAQDTLCEVKERRCGDWTIDEDAWEECDNGNQLNGDGCDTTCGLEPVLTSYAQNWWLCYQNTSPLIVQSNEIVPLTWSLDIVSWVDVNATWCNDLDEWTFIPWWTLLCEVAVNVTETITVPCLIFSDWSLELFDDVISDYWRNSVTTVWWTILSSLNIWRHELILQNISYTYCDTERNGAKGYHTRQEQEVICTMPLTMIHPYRIEKGSTLSTKQDVQSAQLMNESGEVLVDTETYDSVSSISSSVDADRLLKIFMQEFVSEYRWSSIIPAFPFGADQATKKSLTERLHFFMWTQTRQTIRIDDHFLADPEKPFSLVVENADLIIDGSLQWNGMYIVDWGDIRFESQNCDMTDVVEWIFITDGKFETSSTLNTNPYATQRCKWWNLVIRGLFMWSGIDSEFVSRRRAQVDLRSFEKFQQWSSDTQLKKNRLDQSKRLIEGPSVRIDTSPLSWSELPPGVRELFEAISVRR